MNFRPLAATLALAIALLGCRSDETLDSPDLSSSDGLMQRYVSMGNSITAGFQSAGINDSTQRQSYAVLFAQAAGADFFVPSLSMPGCPGPFLVNTTQTRVGGGTGSSCALRAANSYPYLSNTAVPGAGVADLLSNFAVPSASNALTTFILGGRSQVQAMRAAQPTFVSVWIGNNDVLSALTSSANPGDPARITPQGNFEISYSALLDSVEATGAKAAVLSVIDVSAIPYTTPGTVYWCLRTGACPGVPAAPLPPAFTVNNNCAPSAAIPGAKGDSTLIPWSIGISKISAAAGGLPTTINCSVDNEVVLPAEYAALRNAVTGYNTFIAAQAAARDWALIDLNATLLAAKADPARITTFPNLPSAATGGNVTFGALFSLDGVHPSGAAHRLIADSLIAGVNRKYGTTIPFVGP
jgi:hypothetical protein